MRLARGLLLTVLVVASLSLVGARADAAPVGQGAEPPPTVLTLDSTSAGRANALAYSPDGRLLAVGTATGLVLYDAQTLAEVRYFPSTAWVRSLAFSPDGQWLAAGYYEPTVRVWSVSDGTLARALEGHSSWVRSLAFTPDGQTLLTASDDQSLRWWRVRDGALLRTLTDGLAGLRVIAISPDGQTVAAGGADGQVRLLRAADGRLLRALASHTDWIRSLAFSPDGQLLASGAFDASARLWRVSDGALLHTLQGHTFSVLGVAFAPDGKTLATGSVDATIALWRVADGRLQHVLAGHTGFIFAVAYAPDGRTLASGAVDNTVRLWPVGPDSGRVPLAEVPPKVPSTSCVQCHHPRGDFLRPAGITAAPPVADVACAACHAGGTLVMHWCPAFPQAAGVTERHGTWENLSNQVGFPRAERGFALAVAAPGNGEHFYVPALHTVLPVSGQLYGGEVASLAVRLEVWSGGQRTGTAETRTDADGRFVFSTDLRPNGIVLEVPIEERGCVICHSETLAANPAIPPGAVRLLVTATSADGRMVSDERWITVDRSLLANAQVTLLAEAGAAPLPTLPVQASGRLYGWRGRSFSASSDADGVAHLEIEALTEVATDYTFEVPPTVVDGRLYASVAPVTVHLPAGASALPPVTLAVRMQTGQITGRIAGAGSLAVHALHLPEGTRATVQAGPDGAFTFAGLPLGQYRLLPDPAALASLGRHSAPLAVDLLVSPQAEVVLTTQPAAGPARQSKVTDASGGVLPFAWVRAGVDGAAQAADPSAGAWAVVLPAETRSLVASAPGYYSQALAVPADTTAPLAFALTPRPDLQRVAWGDGAVFIPPETRLDGDGLAYTLERGWLWGQGGGQPVQVAVDGVVVTLTEGQFALERAPGALGWLYLLAGQAEARRAGQPESAVALAAPAMLALTATGALQPVPLEPAVISALRPATAPTPLVWAPTLGARLATGLALLGISAAQAVTLATYVAVLLVLAAYPLVRVAGWVRRRRTHPGPHPAR